MNDIDIVYCIFGVENYVGMTLIAVFLDKKKAEAKLAELAKNRSEYDGFTMMPKLVNK